MVLYYPQDTPIEMGPTQVIPATHLHASITDTDRERGMQAPGSAGTCTLIHFDIAHGGSMNLSDRTRHMAKFVFARVEEPTEPSWNSLNGEWQTPNDHRSPTDLSEVWSAIWNWMSGKPAAPNHFNPTGLSTTNLIACWNEDPYTRLRSIYTLASAGSSAVGPLCADLATHTDSRWAESAVVMENAAYALAALGEAAVPSLIALLEDPNDWVQINVLFALGEIGPRARSAASAVIARLQHASHPVVRTALDAVGQMQLGNNALPEIRRLLSESNPDWQEPLYRKWTGEDQVRMNAMMALLRTPSPCRSIIYAAAQSLNYPCGYVGGFAVEILLRHPTPEGMRAAIDYLQTHRWDSCLNRGIRTY